MREQRGGTPAPDSGDEFPAQRARVLHLAIGMAQEDDVHQPKLSRRLHGLAFTAAGDVSHSHGRGVIVRPLVARGDEQ